MDMGMSIQVGKKNLLSNIFGGGQSFSQVGSEIFKQMDAATTHALQIMPGGEVGEAWKKMESTIERLMMKETRAELNKEAETTLLKQAEDSWTTIKKVLFDSQSFPKKNTESKDTKENTEKDTEENTQTAEKKTLSPVLEAEQAWAEMKKRLQSDGTKPRQTPPTKLGELEESEIEELEKQKKKINELINGAKNTMKKRLALFTVDNSNGEESNPRIRRRDTTLLQIKTATGTKDEATAMKTAIPVIDQFCVTAAPICEKLKALSDWFDIDTKESQTKSKTTRPSPEEGLKKKMADVEEIQKIDAELGEVEAGLVSAFGFYSRKSLLGFYFGELRSFMLTERSTNLRELQTKNKNKSHHTGLSPYKKVDRYVTEKFTPELRDDHERLMEKLDKMENEHQILKQNLHDAKYSKCDKKCQVSMQKLTTSYEKFTQRLMISDGISNHDLKSLLQEVQTMKNKHGELTSLLVPATKKALLVPSFFKNRDTALNPTETELEVNIMDGIGKQILSQLMQTLKKSKTEKQSAWRANLENIDGSYERIAKKLKDDIEKIRNLRKANSPQTSSGANAPIKKSTKSGANAPIKKSSTDSETIEKSLGDLKKEILRLEIYSVLMAKNKDDDWLGEKEARKKEETTRQQMLEDKAGDQKQKVNKKGSSIEADICAKIKFAPNFKEGSIKICNAAMAVMQFCETAKTVRQKYLRTGKIAPLCGREELKTTLEPLLRVAQLLRNQKSDPVSHLNVEVPKSAKKKIKSFKDSLQSWTITAVTVLEDRTHKTQSFAIDSLLEFDIFLREMIKALKVAGFTNRFDSTLVSPFVSRFNPLRSWLFTTEEERKVQQAFVENSDKSRKTFRSDKKKIKAFKKFVYNEALKFKSSLETESEDVLPYDDDDDDDDDDGEEKFVKDEEKMSGLRKSEKNQGSVEETKQGDTREEKARLKAEREEKARLQAKQKDCKKKKLIGQEICSDILSNKPTIPPSSSEDISETTNPPTCTKAGACSSPAAGRVLGGGVWTLLVMVGTFAGFLL